MYYLTSAAIGLGITLMIFVNGGLTASCGVYTATVIIHIIGLIATIVPVKIKHERLLPAEELPILLYSGGAVGVLTTIFNNMAFGGISISAILALCLLGQSITSLAIDEMGLFNVPKRGFIKAKLIGYFIIIVGIIVMTFPLKTGSLIFVLVSFLSGATIVISRTIIASLAEKTGVWSSTFWNFAVGLAIALVILPVMGANEHITGGFSLFLSKPYVFIGGILGVLVVGLSSVCVAKISSFYMTLFVFIGQLFSGVVLDMLLSKGLSVEILIGGICATLGLTLNLWLDKRYDLQKLLCQ